MKKLISIALVLSLSLSLAPVNALAASSEAFITRQVSSKNETTLDKDRAPDLIIRADSAYKQNFSFGLILKGAEWSDFYDEKGTLENTQDGITYYKLGANRLRFEVDTTKFDATKNDICIPLLSTLKEEGEISVSIEQRTSSLSEETYPYARLGGRSLSVSVEFVKQMNHTMDMGDVVIKDEFTSPVDRDTVYTLKLGNDFTFKSSPQLVLSGKYQGCITCKIDEKDASKAYLTVTKRTDFGIGSMVLSNLTIGPGKDSVYGPVELTMSRNNDSGTVVAAEYIMPSHYKMPIQIVTFNDGKKPSASGTAAPNKTLQIHIDEEEYGTVDVAQDGTWSYVFPYEYSNISAGKHSFAVGYYLTNGTWFNEVSKEFEIPAEKTTATVIFKIGSPSYTYEGRSGYLDAPAFVDKNNRTMLPLRTVLNTLGIDNNAVKWDEKAQTVTVTQGGKTVVCKIGIKELTINGQRKALDTAPVIKNNRTFLPLRPLLNAFGIADNAILWDNNAQTVSFEV